MGAVKRRLALPEDAAAPPPGPGELVALVDALRPGTLSETQAEPMPRLRAGLVGLAGPGGAAPRPPADGSKEPLGSASPLAR